MFWDRNAESLLKIISRAFLLTTFFKFREKRSKFFDMPSMSRTWKNEKRNVVIFNIYGAFGAENAKKLQMCFAQIPPWKGYSL